VSLPNGTCLFESAFNQHKPFNDFGTIDLIAFFGIREAPPQPVGRFNGLDTSSGPQVEISVLNGFKVIAKLVGG